jgi:ABC-type transport system involved in multi-copper enzyme maturation permease subunit
VPDWVRSARKIRFGLPVLIKDLTELAARRRTYIVRSVYASLLFMAFALFFMAEVSRRGLEYRLMGAGRDMLEFLTIVQLVGVYLFLPAMVAPCIAGEKERGTLGLLFTTDLGPWEILVQKYLGRLAPMFMFLLLSLPLMAVAYTYGGFSSERLLLAAYVIFTTCMQIAAWALMWSAFCRNTSEATGAMYSGAVILGILLGILTGIAGEILGWHGDKVALVICGGFAPPVLLERWWGVSWDFMAFLGILPWVWTALFLLLAKRFLVKRAFKRKARSIQRMLRDLGRFVGSRIFMIVKPSSRVGRTRRISVDLAGERPVAWRELSHSSLGTPGGLLLAATLVGVPVIVAAGIFESYMWPADRGVAFVFAVWAVWAMSALAVTAKSVSAFSLERANQTLELLVTTPLTGREIVSQKAAAIRRRVLLALLLLGVLFIMGACLAYGLRTGNRWSRADLGFLGYLFVSFLSVPIYLWMAGWLAGWIGLRFRKQAHATAIAFGAIFGVCVVPPIAAGILMEFTRSYGSGGPAWLFSLSPATIIVLTEIAKFEDVFDDVFDSVPAVPVILNWIVCIGIGATFRSLCLRNADRYLGRPVASGAPE